MLRPMAVQESRLGPDVASLEVITTSGIIACLRHGLDRGEEATVLYIGGALGGLSGPAHGLYHTLARRLGGVRIHYRRPGELDDCVLDVLLVQNLLARRGVERVALVGHSFGGAVAIAAGVHLGDACAGVVALSTQVPGAERVADLAPRPLLLIHGDSDGILSHACSEYVYDLAGEPKELVIVPGEGHIFEGVSDALADRVEAFLRPLLSTMKS